jgi:membrane protein YdbS with pleckstrin-like domain
VREIGHGIFIGILFSATFGGTAIAALNSEAHVWSAAVSLAAALAGAALLWLLGRRWIHATYRRTSYVVSPRGLEIRRGVWWRDVISVPRSRIQHIDVTQGPVQRAYALATLVLYTAGTQHAKIELDGLAFDTATALRRDLLESDDLSSPGEASREESHSEDAPDSPGNAGPTAHEHPVD